tara:strand:+ start:158 stop:406 length:249 start_codon:yes stop_codon:yes gene_type:complete
MNKIKKIFTEHPHSIGETYFEHLICAAGYGLKMIFVGFAAIIHSVFPFLFETTASDLAKEITGDVDSRKDEGVIQEQTELLD